MKKRQKGRSVFPMLNLSKHNSSRLLSGLLALIVLLAMLIVSFTVVNAEEAVEAEPVLTQASSKQAQVPRTQLIEGIRQFNTYVYAAHQEVIWREHEAFISGLHQESEVLAKFGLESIDTVQQWADKLSEVETDHHNALELKLAAYEALTTTWYAIQPDVNLQLQESQTSDDIELDEDLPELVELKEALQALDQSIQKLNAVQLQQQMGHIIQDDLAIHAEAVLQAKLRVIVAKQSLFTMILNTYPDRINFLTDWFQWMERFESQLDIPLLQDWMKTATSYATEPYSNLNVPMPAAEQQSSEEYILKKPLPVSSVTLMTAPVILPKAPFISDAKEVFVPLRPIAEAAGYKVLWMPEQESVHLLHSGVRITLYLDKNVFVINDRIVDYSGSAPFMQYHTTYVPLRVLSSGLYFDVYWNEDFEQAVITPPLYREEG